MIAESAVIRKAKNYGALFELLLSNMFESTRISPSQWTRLNPICMTMPDHLIVKGSYDLLVT